MKQLRARVLSNNPVGPGYYYLEMKASEIALSAFPGQFLHVKVNEGLDPLLRRPLSLHEIEGEKGILGLLYQVRGKGTEILSRKTVGEEIDIMGPLGKGFNLDFSGSHAVIVGGGIGIAPLYPLAKELTRLGKKVLVMLGARSSQAVLAEERFLSLGCRVIIVTNDGSKGSKGNVTDILAEYTKVSPVHYLYACGPEVMLAEVEKICLHRGIAGEVSLEAYMGCGVGACLSCSCERKETVGRKYAKVCTDGPVFPIGEVKLSWQLT